MTEQLRMAYVQTPFRISFFGGGTDFPDFFNEHGGAVIGTTINRYSYVALNLLERIKDSIIKLTYSRLEVVKDIAELQHPIVKCVLENHPEFLDNNKFIDLHSFADLPSKSGIGSSSAFTVGLLQAFYTLLGIYRSPEQLAYEAIDIERNKLKDAGGWQDQIMCAYGGLNRIDFHANSFSVNHVTLKSSVITALESSLLFFYTQEQRSSGSIQQQAFSKKNIADKSSYLKDILAAVDESMKITQAEHDEEHTIKEFGELMHRTWMLKKSLAAGISSPSIEAYYDAARSAGAHGGKVSGAGGGGFMFFCVPQDRQKAVTDKLESMGAISIPVKFTRQPSRVLFASGTK